MDHYSDKIYAHDADMQPLLKCIMLIYTCYIIIGNSSTTLVIKMHDILWNLNHLAGIEEKVL